MLELEPVTPSQVEAKWSKGKINAKVGQKSKEEIEAEKAAQAYAEDKTRALDKHERMDYFMRHPDVESEKSEGEIPYVDFNDFDE